MPEQSSSQELAQIFSSGRLTSKEANWSELVESVSTAELKDMNSERSHENSGSIKKRGDSYPRM